MPIETNLLFLELSVGIALVVSLSIFAHLRKIKTALGKLRVALSDQYNWNPVVRTDLLLVRPEEWLLKDSLEAFRDIYMAKLQMILPGNLSLILDDLVIVLKPNLGIDYRYAILKPWFSSTKYLIQINLRLFNPLKTKEKELSLQM